VKTGNDKILVDIAKYNFGVVQADANIEKFLKQILQDIDAILAWKEHPNL
jgi:hypothetical protein